MSLPPLVAERTWLQLPNRDQTSVGHLGRAEQHPDMENPTVPGLMRGTRPASPSGRADQDRTRTNPDRQDCELFQMCDPEPSSSVTTDR